MQKSCNLNHPIYPSIGNFNRLDTHSMMEMNPNTDPQICTLVSPAPLKNQMNVKRKHTVDSEIFARILFSRIALKDILVMRKIRD